MLLLNFPHRKQQAENDGLVACADMALLAIGIEFSYPRLPKLLKAGPLFTPFTNLRYLEALHLSIQLGKNGDWSIFEQHIELGLPVIVGVTTIGWQHWQQEITQHAVVVVGIDRANDLIYLHDPFFEQAPLAMPLLEFEIGWIEKEREYAIISLVEPG